MKSFNEKLHLAGITQANRRSDGAYVVTETQLKLLIEATITHAKIQIYNTISDNTVDTAFESGLISAISAINKELT